MKTLIPLTIVILLLGFGGCTKTGAIPEDNLVATSITAPHDSLDELSTSAKQLIRDVKDAITDNDNPRDFWFWTIGRSLAKMAVALQRAPTERQTFYLPILKKELEVYNQKFCPCARSYREDQAVLTWVKQFQAEDSTTWTPPEVLLRGALE
ncbi:MAG: hypothetical protein PHV78_00055 [Patescibacteria group bacterium]|nr:hypothetical protein [Patescibacteria group bacterium]MDD5121430.1 hypothetical protein [Patescibacteria group bacterium]MDD5221884.1 hypothetical protein [Patescibacteria group bacterium]MDD5395651.1 hypothetical protein [Patescibacteria group bacterium]